MCRLAFAIASLIITLTAVDAHAQTTVLNFDDAEAPCTFSETGPLRDQYARLGVIFDGGMTVLNECGNFGIVEHSSVAFLAWNSSTDDAGPPATLTFTHPVSSFSFLTGSHVEGTVTATAYDRANNVLATHTVNLVPSAIPVILDARNIERVVITSTAVYGAIDDIQFTSNPR